MTTRNQRRNRQLAIARDRVRALEQENAQLRAELAKYREEYESCGACDFDTLKKLQAQWNRLAAKQIEQMAMNPRTPWNNPN